MVTIQDYKTLIEDRPEKFSSDEVAYRDAEGKEHCSNCIHFFVRQLDGFGVCEIQRSDKTDETGVDPDYVCDFWTKDGEKFPLRPRER